MWVDELYSFDLIQDPSLPHMLAASGDQADGSPPLYYLLVRPWATVFGLSELSLRLFTSLAFCVAFVLIWKMLRRAYAFWPSALALALVIGTSHVIRFENCNVRFYGLLFALVALAAFLSARLGEQEHPGTRLLAANTLTQAALVLCHPLGGFYSAALFIAVVCGDWLILRRWRWSTALSYPAGWLALLLWVRQLMRQADLNRPHSWVPVPEFHDIASVLYGGSDFYPLFVLFVLLAAWRVLGFRAAHATRTGGRRIPGFTARRVVPCGGVAATVAHRVCADLPPARLLGVFALGAVQPAVLGAVCHRRQHRLDDHSRAVGHVSFGVFRLTSPSWDGRDPVSVHRFLPE